MFILLHPYKFTEFHHMHYELDFFEKKLCTEIEIHDLSQIINPKWDKAFRLKRHKKAKRFNSIIEWDLYMKRLVQKKHNIVVFNNLDLNSFKSLVIQSKLSKYCKKIIKLDDPAQPNYWYEKKGNFSISNYKNKVLNVLKNPNSFKFFIKTKFLGFLCKFIVFDKIYNLYHGNSINFKPNLRCKKEFFVNIHSPDYSRMISYNKKKIKIKKPFVIFLDGPGPHFINDYNLFGVKIKYDKKLWYSDLNKFLFKIEKTYSCKVIIVPHPKVKRSLNPYYSKKLKVCHDLDAAHKFIPISKFVISIAASTAVGLACASNKPIILIYNDQIKKLNPSQLDYMKFMSKKYKTSLINLNENDQNYLKKINKINNKKITYQYLSSKNISKKKNYEIFNKILKGNYNSSKMNYNPSKIF
tara:strand:+ start:32799 stop:34031 length:1233 start_codon:yes stop_codon:yes gene_type:complete